MKQSEKIIFQALCYSDIFDYPLTVRELWMYSLKKIKLKQFLSNLSSVPHITLKGIKYYVLPGRESIVTSYIKKQPINQKKILIAKRVANMLSHIPTISFIGISGSLATRSASSDADIDLFFISRPHTVWLTRFLVYACLHMLGLKRERNTHIKDKICANMFFSRDNMRLPLKKRTIYGAREILQIFPLFDRENTYADFLLANTWITKYFPNIIFKKRIAAHSNNFLWTIIAPIEFIARKIQVWYMRNRRTTEIATPSLIAFHPIDYETIILREYEKRKKQYGI